MSEKQYNIFNKKGDETWPSRKDHLIKGLVSININVIKQIIICKYHEYTLPFIS